VDLHVDVLQDGKEMAISVPTSMNARSVLPAATRFASTQKAPIIVNAIQAILYMVGKVHLVCVSLMQLKLEVIREGGILVFQGG
jgi:hypothetical protein